MKLLEDLLLLEAKTLRDEVAATVKRATAVPFTVKQAPKGLIISLDGTARGHEAADDHEVFKVLKRLETDLDRYRVKRLYQSRVDADKPTGLSIHPKSGGARLAQVWFGKRALQRDKVAGDHREEHKQLKLSTRSSDLAESNAKLFVAKVSDALKTAGGELAHLTLDGRTNDNKLVYDGVKTVKWLVDSDVQLTDSAGKHHRLKLLPRNFSELKVDNELFRQVEGKLYDRLQDALTSAQVKFDDAERLHQELHHELAVKLSSSEAAQVYLGTCEGVLIETFVSRDFKLTGKHLVVSCDYVVESVKGLHARLWPYFSLNSDETDQAAKPLIGKVFMRVVPRFHLKTHERKSGGKPKTLVLDR